MGKIDHNKSHAIDSSTDHTSAIVEDNLISGDSNGLPKDTGVAASNVKKHNFAASATPTEDDDDGSGYTVGSKWWYADARKLFVCFDASTGSAVWKMVMSNCLVSNKTGGVLSQLFAAQPDTPQGNFPTVKLAKADTEADSAAASGVILDDIADNGKGFVINDTNIYDVDGSGTTFGESWSVGDILWLSAATAGYLTKTAPTAPNHATRIAQVISNHSTQGILKVSVQNGFEITELHDVDETPAVANEFLLSNGTKYSATNFDTEVSANSDVVTNSAHSAGDGTDHSGVATKELDNLGTTAVNADIDPASDNTIDLGTPANKFKNINAVDFIFEDSNDDDFTAMDLALHQLEAYNELATTEFDITAATAGGVRTLTATQPDSQKHEFIIAGKRLEQPTQTTMTTNHTGLSGTDADPNNVYTYFKNTADAPDMTASNADPNGSTAHVDAVYEVVGSVAGSASNIYATNNIQASIHEKIEKMLDRFKEQGTLYKSGMAITADIDTFSITTGTAKHVLSDATIPTLTIENAGGSDNQFTIEDDSTYTTYDTLQIDEYYDGVATSNNHHIKCRVGVVINNPELTSARFHIIPQNGAATYTTPSQAWADLSGMSQTTPRNDIVKYAFVDIADIVIKNNSGTFELIANPDTGLFYSDVRGQAGEGGGGGGAASQNLYETFTGDSGSSTASSSTDSMVVVGGTGLTTAVTDDQISVALDTPVTEANGGTGESTYTDGQLLIGKTDNSLTKATLTAGEGIDVTNGDGTITILGEDASTTNKGILEIGTAAEIDADTASLAVAPDQLILSKYKPQDSRGFIIDGGGSAIIAGKTDYFIEMDVPGTITKINIKSSVSGVITAKNISCDLYKNAGKISASDPIDLTGGSQSDENHSSFTGWSSTTFVSGDNFNIDVTGTPTAEYIIITIFYDVTGA